MNGTWDDVNRRLVGALLALDLDDVLVVGERAEPARRGWLAALVGSRPTPAPRRWVMVTAARDALVAECVGSTSFGGEWETSAEAEAALRRQGWEEPWSPEHRTWQRQAPLAGAPRIALAAVRALEVLGCEVADLEVTRTREEPTG